MSQAEYDRGFVKWVRRCLKDLSPQGSVTDEELKKMEYVLLNGAVQGADDLRVYPYSDGLLGLLHKVFEGDLARRDPGKMRTQIGWDSAMVVGWGHANVALGNMPEGFEPDYVLEDAANN